MGLVLVALVALLVVARLLASGSVGTSEAAATSPGEGTSPVTVPATAGTAVGTDTSGGDGADAVPAYGDPTDATEGSVGDVTRWESADDVGAAASALLEGYRDGSVPAVLVQAGYLDLLGDVWGCTVRGPAWVDVCLVAEAGGGSSVRVLRMEVDRWEELYGDVT
ncbi:MAG: hypothetical protein PHR15_03855 [Atopobiaceae bacterium]|jgi:hypothetical protein|nr:hypothetical protein [Atopobiaceae bacterium]MCH4214336.1 hypothetical protein [Atopobiaceae bacterium]MCH4276604.1 hypothetical protein [Atopobiaceae bacterium]MDD3177870.1 hypothetical protein [Atopobiaceae bacterium]MDD4380592.1 hypothetical protein [Atopobiaceae bacterium]